MLPKEIAQIAIDSCLRISTRLDYRGKVILWRLHAALMRSLGLNSALVRYELFGHRILVPASFGLASSLERNPGFEQNLARVASAVVSKYPDLTIVDIGANVGDTALLFRSATTAPILCVEGSDTYYPLCKQNLSDLSDIEIAHTYIDSSNDTIVGTLVEEGGSGRIVPDATGRPITVRPLSELLHEHPRFEHSKLLKIDADGFDGRIILGAIPWIQRYKPIIFWEYELLTDAKNKGPGRRILDKLQEAGYGHFIFYNHIGDYVATANADDARLLDDLSSYTCLKWNRDHVAPNFADICAIANEDNDLLAPLRERELTLRQINLVGNPIF